MSPTRKKAAIQREPDPFAEDSLTTLIKNVRKLRGKLDLQHPLDSGTVKAWQEMHEALEGISKALYPPGDKTGPRGRLPVRVALMFAVEFLECVFPYGGLLNPLINLENALADLDRGVVGPLLKVELGNNCRPRGQTLVQGAAAATMTLLMKTRDSGKKTSRKDAAKLVAEQLRLGGIRLGIRREGEDWPTVADWREQAIKKIKSKSPKAASVADPVPTAPRDLLAWSYERWLASAADPVPADEREHLQYRAVLLRRLLKMTRFSDEDSN